MGDYPFRQVDKFSELMNKFDAASDFEEKVAAIQGVVELVNETEDPEDRMGYAMTAHGMVRSIQNKFGVARIREGSRLALIVDRLLEVFKEGLA